MIQSVCVYCGSRAGNEPGDEAAAARLGSALAARRWSLVYGGGSIGLMGTLARAVLQSGGEVIGIIPQALLECEVGLVEASELVVTSTMRERKALMDARADAFVALPGGFGTLEELMETLTLYQIGYHTKPIIIVNRRGFYDPLFALFAHLVGQGFVSPQHTSLYHIATDVEQAVALLEQFNDHHVSAAGARGNHQRCDNISTPSGGQ